MRPLDCLSGDVSLYDSINCNPAVLGKTSEEPISVWGCSAINQTTATPQLVIPFEDKCDYFDRKAAIIS